MNKINQAFTITSISIFVGLSLISGISTRMNTESQFSVISVPKISHQKTNQPFIAPNRGTPQTTAGGGIRGFYLQPQL
ncbi:hypothetical protein [Anabaena sp. UHCC 0399]|uniref:hypothetical protein n=1 Tax=Anabaena sp. UHCC 0399 TaxID=3110238 RepID=UPI002B20024D|nr:hypothetical protein [Anabaena sp. UHCC 0399]MEA5568474.1 hypothetical protein [Anabaena sp. UHCC 0399]